MTRIEQCLINCLKLLIIAFALISITALWSRILHDAGVIPGKSVDLALLEEENPAYKSIEIEKATDITGTVTAINGYNHFYNVKIKCDGYPNLVVMAYLSEKDTAKLHIGDQVVLRGKIKYYDDDYIVIGDAITVFPISFPAKIVSINGEY